MSTIPTTMTFEEAAAYVQREKAPVYGLLPKTRHGRLAGAEVYVLYYDPGHGADPETFSPYYLGYFCEFPTLFDYQEAFAAEVIAEEAAEALALSYRPAATYAPDWLYLRLNLHVLVALLEGAPHATAVATDPRAFWERLETSLSER